MKKLLGQIACVAALLAPGFASAASTYTDSYAIDLTSALSNSNVSILSTWIDAALFDGVTVAVQDAASLGWTLTTGGVAPTTVRTGTIFDTPGYLGSSIIAIQNLAAGYYTLTLSGTWNALSGAGIPLLGSVNLVDGDSLVDGTREANSISITAVPEPETYAMMLAGLMMMGTIARRRGRRG